MSKHTKSTTTIRGVGDEPHWIQFVRDLGGKQVQELLTKESIFGIENADFIFPSHEAIVELKVLETEHLENPNFISKIASLIDKHRFDQDDSLLDNDLTSTLKSPLEKIIKKANRQIRSTKDALRLNHEFKGMIAVMNSGWIDLSPDSALLLFKRIFLKSDRYSSVNGVFFYSNFPLEVPGTSRRVWLSFCYLRDPKDEQFSRFCRFIESSWGQFSQQKLGEKYGISVSRQKGSHASMKGLNKPASSA